MTDAEEARGTDELPDLPELESVETKDRASVGTVGLGLNRRRAFLFSLDAPARQRIQLSLLVNFLFFAAGVVFGGWLVLSGVLVTVSRHLFAGPHARYFIAPSTFAASPLLGAGVFFGNVIGARVGECLAGPYKAEWRQYGSVSSRYGRRADKVSLWIFIVLTAVSPFGFLAAVHSYARFTDEGIAISRFCTASETFHSWSSVQRVESVATENVYHGRRHSYISAYRIRFTDGYTWRCLQDVSQEAGLAKAMRFVSAKSGKPMVVVRDGL